MEAPIRAAQVTIVPANEASWDDIVAVFGTADYAAHCHCQRFKVLGWMWRDSTEEERTAMFRAQTACGNPDAGSTSGLVAYVEGEPAGWVAVEPRTAYPKLRTSRVPWTGRDEDKDDDSVWAVTCFAVRKGYRGRGLTYLLAQATIDFARDRGARALEAYPMFTQPGKEITWGELHVGPYQAFEEAGFRQVSRPTVRRAVMRIDFEQAQLTLTSGGRSLDEAVPRRCRRGHRRPSPTPARSFPESPRRSSPRTESCPPALKHRPR
jgi:GNAT superfamily N-acetyltransferase